MKLNEKFEETAIILERQARLENKDLFYMRDWSWLRPGLEKIYQLGFEEGYKLALKEN